MAEKQFVWLIQSSSPRRGPKLIKGKVHDVKNYPPEVVEEWVKTGAAEYVTSPKKSKEEKE
jgi:hypothetical protein